MKCSKRFRKIHRETLVPEPLFNKVLDLQAYNFIKKWVKLMCLPENFAKSLRTSFYKTKKFLDVLIEI